jgi:hypothetical protein
MRLEPLPAPQRTFAIEGRDIIAGLHAHRGYRYYSRFALVDGQPLPGRDYLERGFVDEVDGAAAP